MGSVSATDVLDRLVAFGCAVRVEGEKLKVRGPNLPELAGLVSELRACRNDALTILRQVECNAPSIEEVKADLPAGVRLVSYLPKQVPFAVAPVSVVTNAGKFYRAYLRDLKARLERPDGFHCPPLQDILSKLADAGLELEIKTHGAFVNAEGILVSDDDLPLEGW